MVGGDIHARVALVRVMLLSWPNWCPTTVADAAFAVATGLGVNSRRETEGQPFRNYRKSLIVMMIL